MEFKSNITSFVNNFEKWRKDNHTTEQYINGYTDDPGYPLWEKIEKELEYIFKNNILQNLSNKEIEGIIYLIARNWDVSHIISWLNIHNQKHISSIGLSEKQFIFLSPFAIKSTEEDAKSQFAKVLPYLKDTPKNDIIELLLKLYAKGGEYTKRLCLYSLLKMNYHKIEKLTLKSWKDYNDEYHKIGCLHILNEIKSEFLPQYLKYAEKYQEWDLLQKKVIDLKRMNSL